MLRSARRREALRRPLREDRGGGISWRPPAYSLLKNVSAGIHVRHYMAPTLLSLATPFITLAKEIMFSSA